ncbi:MAG: 30S ribosomal protein S3 [Candidatus Bathyarchaeia archaeon]|nr:30S ribosomal protein S3 [Candidatus Bathyarchaeota archaeon]
MYYRVNSVRKIIDEDIKKASIEEFLKDYLKDAGFGGVSILTTPLGTRVTLYVMRPGMVIGRGGQNIMMLSKMLEEKFGLENVQIAVADVPKPELDPYIMACQIAAAMERGIKFRRAAYWALNRIMSAGALGVEIKISGKLTSERARTEAFRAGYLPKSGDPAMKNVKTASVSVLLKPGIYGIKVSIIPPEAEFPDKIELKLKEESIKEEKVEEG